MSIMSPEKTNRTQHKQPHKQCTCYGKPQTCNVCITQKNIYASRAGTPGFRPPEVLLKSKNQTQGYNKFALNEKLIFYCIYYSH